MRTAVPVGTPTTRFRVQRLGHREVARVTDSRTTAVGEADLVAMAYGHVHGARIGKEMVTDVVPFDEAPRLFAELSARRRHVITAVLPVPEP